MLRNDTHENFRRDDGMRAPSERNFGLVFAGVFLVIGIAPIVFPPRGEVRVWALLAAAGFLVCALFWTSLLRPLNARWFRLGLLLHAISTPIIMGFLFYGVITPIALAMRLFGKNFLSLKQTPEASTYWIRRNPIGPAPDTMKNQF
jgi:hypothetical protein